MKRFRSTTTCPAVRRAGSASPGQRAGAMKRPLFLMAILGCGALVVRLLLSPERRERMAHLKANVRERMMERMERMMEQMPDDFPPKLIMSTLPRLQEQSDEILALLRAQNDRLREHFSTQVSSLQETPSAKAESQQEVEPV